MTTQVHKLVKKALELTEKERADLATRLLQTLEPGMTEEIRVAWQEELDRRMGELNRGQMKTIPWPKVRRRILG